MAKDNKEKIVNPTEEQIAEWKAMYGEVHLVEVAKDVKEPDTVVDLDTVSTYKAYLRKPSRQVKNLVITQMQDPIQAGKTLIKNCWLAGDHEINSHEDISATAALNSLGIMDQYEARIKKL